MKRTSLFLTKHQIEILQKLQKQTGLKMSEQIRRAIDKYIKEI